MRKHILSQKGVHFTATSVEALRMMNKEDVKDGMYLILVIGFNEEGQLDPAFGYDYESHPQAIKDQLEDTIFEWWADSPEFEQVREKYCVDAEWGRKTKFIPLSEKNKK